MAAPRALIRHISDGDLRYDGLMFWCPGCERVDEDGSRHAGLHMLPVNSTVKTPQWDWNGSLESPTLNPSILTRGNWKGAESICHSFMRDGQMQFLDDCTHALRVRPCRCLHCPTGRSRRPTMARREKCDGCGQPLGWDDDGLCWTCTQEEVNERAGVRGSASAGSYQGGALPGPPR